MIGGFSIHFIATRLLQLTVVSSARVNHSASHAACHECSSSSCHEPVIAWPCETSVEAATLAAGWAKNYIQAESDQAPHGRYRLRSTGSAVYVLPRTRTRFGKLGFFHSSPSSSRLATLFLSTFTTLLTPVHSENVSRVYFLIVFTTARVV